ncbi:MAG: OsmC family protein [Solirubrobacterales bacterium]|nr:OsmC family protein [Solirubrobacterales bacterium]HRV59847.1 OsmC family protein [Solirubrobacterales bacterium]
MNDEPHTYTTRLVLEGGEDIRAHRVEMGAQSLAASSAPEFGGDPEKADPEEMTIAAISSCHMLWFIAYARAKRHPVSSYEDQAEIVLDGDRFTSAVLRPKVEFEGERPDDDFIDGLHERAHKACFVANSVNFPVDVEPQ